MEFFERLLENQNQEREDSKDYFGKLNINDLKTYNKFYSKINSSTKAISLYFDKAVEKFPSLFEKDLESFEDCLDYLEKKSIPNKCVCAGIIDNIPAWRCVDCSKYENTIYCNDCYKNSEDWHKGHKVFYLTNSRGMCDCGDPDSLNQFCREHSGPFKEEKEIESFILQSFEKKIVDNLKKYFDEFFLEYSKYFVLTSKCELFLEDLLDEKFKGDLSTELDNEKNDVIFLKSNFCIIFQNFIYFLRLITKNNLGIFHLIANYFLKNHLESIKLEDEYLIDHRCIVLNQQEIKIFYDTVKKENHVCKCPFLRLFMANYRNDVKLKSKKDEQEFIFYFSRDLPLRAAFCILLFFLYNQNLYNNNENINYCRTQFYLEDGIELIARQTNFLENSIELIYKYLLKKIKQKEGKEQNILKKEIIKKIYRAIENIYEDVKYYSKPKIKQLMTDKTLYYEKFIDLTCLFQNIYEFVSIVPHPSFQKKSLDNYMYKLENILSTIPGLLCCCFDWNKIDKIKVIYKYIINKILNQKEEEVNQLVDNEFSFFFSLYRCFGVFINTFCFNYSFLNNCTILESLNYFKKNIFESQEQIDKFVNIILKDYYKLFGFIVGCKNNFFNYYVEADVYFPIYTRFNFYKNDFTLLKYLFILSEKEINLNSYLKLSNVENVYSIFDNIFNLGKIFENDIDMKPNKEEPNENLNFEDFNFALLNDLSDEERNILNKKYNNKDKSQDDFNIIMQWEILLQFLILILKDDSSCYWSLISIYDELLSSKTRMELFNNIRSNKFAMNDLKNILKEKIIIIILSHDNSIDKQKLEKNIDDYLLILFGENNMYNEILEELTYNKMSGETKFFYLKDEYLKYLDCNYFVDLKNKSATEKYILNFKKDIVKTYNYYYYNHTELTFDFFEKVYEKVLLSKDNLDLIIKIIEKLLNNERVMEHLDKKSIRNSLLPIILNYLLMFSVINTKSFIEFKLSNKTTINKLYDILLNFVKNNDKDNIIDKDLEDHINEVLNKINLYQLIYDNYKGDLTKLNKFDYNTNVLQQLINNNDINNNINIKQEEKNLININNEIKEKSNDNVSTTIKTEKKGENVKFNQKKNKRKNFFYDENGVKFENIIIDHDEIILKDEKVIKLMKEQEELLKKKKNRKLNDGKEKYDGDLKLQNLNEELERLRKEYSKYKQVIQLDADEKLMSVIFIYEELGIEYSVVCKNTDILLEVFENQLRKEKDALENYNQYIFRIKDDNANPWLSMKKNQIYDGDIIYIFSK